MDKNIFEGNWNQLKGSIKEIWGDLSDDDLDKISGQKDKLIGLIEEKYGETKENIEDKLEKFFEK